MPSPTATARNAVRRPRGLRLPWPVRGGGCPAEAGPPRAVYRPGCAGGKKEKAPVETGSDRFKGCGITHEGPRPIDRYAALAPGRFRNIPGAGVGVRRVCRID